MKFSTLLLTGVSIAAISAAPAFARSAPEIHAVTSHGHLLKSRIHDPKASNFTETGTFTWQISTATEYKVKTVILGETWLYHDATNSTCTFPPKEHWKGLPKKTKYAKISVTTTTATYPGNGCPASDPGPSHNIVYKLKVKNAAGQTDSFTGTLAAKHWTLPSGVEYNLYLNANIDVSITS